MNNNYDYSYEWDHGYCYPHSNVLINKLGIKDAEKLHIAEREITSLRIANAKVNVIKGDFDLLHLRKIHKYMKSRSVLHIILVKSMSFTLSEKGTAEHKDSLLNIWLKTQAIVWTFLR